MQWIIPLTLASIYCFFLTLTIGLLPNYWVFSQSHFKTILRQARVYDHIVPTVQEQWRKTITKPTLPNANLFDYLILEHAQDLLTKAWITDLANSLIETAFVVLEKKIDFPDLDIDISSLKQNMITLLEDSDIRADIPKFVGTIPETVRLSMLLQQDVSVLSHYLRVISVWRESIKLLWFASIGITILTLLCMYLLSNRYALWIWVWGSHVLAGSVWLLTAFVFWFGMVSSCGLPRLLTQSQSVWEVLSWVVAVTFMQSILPYWAWVGLASFALGIIGLLYKVLWSNLPNHS